MLIYYAMQRLCPLPLQEKDGIYHMAVSMLPHHHLPTVHDVESTGQFFH